MNAIQKSLPAAALIACVALSGFCSCSSADGAASGHPDELVGVIQVIGNEPFTALAVQTADGTMHRVRASRDLERRLYARQGKTFRLSVVQIHESPLGPVAEISAATQVSP